MKRFVLFEEEIREGIAKITGIKPRSIENCAFYNRTWGVMKKSSKLSYLYNVLFNSETYPLEVHEEWDKAIETKVNERLAGKTKTRVGGTGETLTKADIMKVKDSSERQRLIAQNRELF